MGILYFLILLSVIVIIHEGGHLLTAKLFNVYCYEFSVGMGPKLFSKKFKETVFSIRLIPMGGYVAMAGENDGMSEVYKDIEVPYERTLTGCKPWKKIIIMLAGVTMNFLLAWVIASMVFLSYGSIYADPAPIVAGVVEGSAASMADFAAGDVITKAVLDDGTVIVPDDFYDVSDFTMVYDGEITYYLDRNGKEVVTTVRGIKDEETGYYVIGLYMPERDVVKITPLNCWKQGGEYLLDVGKMLMISLARLFRGRGLDQVSGPVGIYNAASEAVSYGFDSFMLLMAILSLNVGIFNLLPLPVLDGGRAVITLGEAITGKKLNQKVEMALMALCWVLLIGLMIFATWQDILRLFR